MLNQIDRLFAYCSFNKFKLLLLKSLDSVSLSTTKSDNNTDKPTTMTHNNQMTSCNGYNQIKEEKSSSRFRFEIKSIIRISFNVVVVVFCCLLQLNSHIELSRIALNVVVVQCCCLSLSIAIQLAYTKCSRIALNDVVV